MKYLFWFLLLFTNSILGLEKNDGGTESSLDLTKQLHTKCQTTKEADGGSNLCDISGFASEEIINCNTLLNNANGELGKLPKDAFIYALKVLKKNATSFASKQCYKHDDGKRFFSKKKFENKYMGSGIKNKCMILINTPDQKFPKGKICQSMSYVIDICKTKSGRPATVKGHGRGVDSKFVRHFPSFTGYGTCKSIYDTKGQYINRAGEGTTLLGAFVTGPKFDYGHQNTKAYRDLRYWIRKAEVREKGKKAKAIGVPAANLWGLNTTNSRASSDNKYLHVSPYTSAGCVSIPLKDYKVVTEMAKRGPSLVINYKKGRMEDIDVCSGDKKIIDSNPYTGEMSERYEKYHAKYNKWKNTKNLNKKRDRELSGREMSGYLKLKKIRNKYLKQECSKYNNCK